MGREKPTPCTMSRWREEECVYARAVSHPRPPSLLVPELCSLRATPYSSVRVSVSTCGTTSLRCGVPYVQYLSSGPTTTRTREHGSRPRSTTGHFFTCVTERVVRVVRNAVSVSAPEIRPRQIDLFRHCAGARCRGDLQIDVRHDERQAAYRGRPSRLTHLAAKPP